MVGGVGIVDVVESERSFFENTVRKYHRLVVFAAGTLLLNGKIKNRPVKCCSRGVPHCYEHGTVMSYFRTCVAMMIVE